MNRVPILSKTGCAEGLCRIPSSERPLPHFYMNDYSIIGLLVDRLPEALRILEENDFSVIRESAGFEVATDGADGFRRMFELLTMHGIDCDIADVVGEVYQG